jgi:hypothetical protein
MHALLICDINPYRKTKSVINYENIGCRDHLHFLKALDSINSTPMHSLPLQVMEDSRLSVEQTKQFLPIIVLTGHQPSSDGRKGAPLTGFVREP